MARIARAPFTERYPSDVTDAEWALIAPVIPPPSRGQTNRLLRELSSQALTAEPGNGACLRP